MPILLYSIRTLFMIDYVCMHIIHKNTKHWNYSIAGPEDGSNNDSEASLLQLVLWSRQSQLMPITVITKFTAHNCGSVKGVKGYLCKLQLDIGTIKFRR